MPFLPFEAKKARSSPPRLRNPRSDPLDYVQRAQRILPSCSATPPPLPETALLPLRNVRQPTSAPLPQQFHPSALNPLATSSPFPPKGFDQFPAATELLSRISSTKAGVQDLRSQLADFHTHNSQRREAFNQFPSHATPDMDLFRSFKTDSNPFVIKPSRPAVTWQGNNETDPHEAGNAVTPRLPTNLRSNAS